MSNIEEHEDNSFDDESIEHMLDDVNNIKDEEEDDILAKKQKKNNAKRGIVIAVCALLGISALGGVFVADPFGVINGDKDTDSKTTTTDASDNGGSATSTANTQNNVGAAEEFYQQDGQFYPEKYNDWQISSFLQQNETAQADFDKTASENSSTSDSVKDNDSSDSVNDTSAQSVIDEKLKKEILDYYSDSEMTSSSNTLPSEESGYTSDPAQEYLEDGSMNPYYSFWTAEVFQAEVGTDIQRLINPSFGGWDLYQYSAYPANTYFNMDLVSDMFTERWITDNSSKNMSEYVPVYADWEGNDYGLGDQLLDSGPRWYGQVTSSNTTFQYDDSIQQYTVNMEINVKYTAWTKSQTKLEKNAVLTLKLVPNINGAGKSSHRVLIDEASLKVE